MEALFLPGQENVTRTTHRKAPLQGLLRGVRKDKHTEAIRLQIGIFRAYIKGMSAPHVHLRSLISRGRPVEDGTLQRIERGRKAPVRMFWEPVHKIPVDLQQGNWTRRHGL